MTQTRLDWKNGLTRPALESTMSLLESYWNRHALVFLASESGSESKQAILIRNRQFRFIVANLSNPFYLSKSNYIKEGKVINYYFVFYRFNLMVFRKCLKYIRLLILCLSTIVIYLLFRNHDTLISQSLNVPFMISNTSDDIISEIKQIKENLTFESRLFDYYPHLPIHIFTQKLSLIGNTSKLILLGNTFFGRQTWDICTPGRSSTETSKT